MRTEEERLPPLITAEFRVLLQEVALHQLHLHASLEVLHIEKVRKKKSLEVFVRKKCESVMQTTCPGKESGESSFHVSPWTQKKQRNYAKGKVESFINMW